VSKEVATLPKKNSYRSNSAEFLQVKQRVAGMKPLTSQQIADQQEAGGYNRIRRRYPARIRDEGVRS